MSGFVVVIPARYASERLPGKPLRELAGKPMIRHVHERARESKASDVVIATDDERIAEAAAGFGARVCMTGAHHTSGTERLAEVCEIEGWPDTARVVNLQGDEPLMPAALIDQCAALLDDEAVDIATLASPLRSDEDFYNPNIVKVVCAANGDALYFSRAPIPHPRHAGDIELAMQTALHHHGLYGYRVAVLKQLVAAGAGRRYRGGPRPRRGAARAVSRRAAAGVVAAVVLTAVLFVGPGPSRDETGSASPANDRSTAC